MMRAFRLAAYELLRFRTPMQRAGLAFLLVVPLLYGGIYLWSNWDPYGRLSEVPVAVVNDDRPVEAEGRTVNAGDQLVSQLKKNPLLGWRFTDDADAADGLKDGRYYAVITVPHDFSAKLTSGATGTPEQAAMSIRLDDANNFLVGIMAETVQSELERQVAAAAVATYFEVAFGKLDELHDGLTDAASGAAQLRDGLGQAKDGSGQLVQGLGAADQGTATLADGLGQAKNGTDALVTGLGTLKNGTGTLAGGLGELKAGTGKLAPGAAELARGIHKLTGEAVPIAEDLSAALPGLAAKAVTVSGDAADLTALAAALSARVAKVTKAIDDWLHSIVQKNPEIARSPRFRDLREAIQNLDGTIARRMRALAQEFPEVARDPGYARALKAAETVDTTLVSRLHRLADKHPELDDDPVWDAILKLADEIAARARHIAREAAKVNDTTQTIARDARKFQKGVPAVRRKLNTAVTGLKKLDKGGATVAAGVRTVDKGVGSALTGANALDKGAGTALAGARKLDAGDAKLLTGANALHRGSGELLDGARRLDEGNAQLQDGAGELASGLDSAEKPVPVVDSGDQRQYAKTLAEPVNVTKSNAHPAGKYGRGLAPFFISIAMWVFGIVAFLLLRPVSGRVLASRARAGTVAFAAWLPVMFMGGCSALVLFAVLNWGLGLKPVNSAATVGLMLLGMASFSAIVHVLRLALGAVGDALALALLILQLVSCGGLYPVETLPQPFRAIHDVIPMTYLVAPLRATISGGEPSHVVRDAGILAAYLVAALAALVLIVRAQRRWSMGRLKPELEL
jgi:putative membrane protein